MRSEEAAANGSGDPYRLRLIAADVPIRCLVRDPRRLGDDRVRVQIALGDLADPPSFRNALRGVDTVIHLAATIRDQPQGSIEELTGMSITHDPDAQLGARLALLVLMLQGKLSAIDAVRDALPPGEEAPEPLRLVGAIAG